MPTVVGPEPYRWQAYVVIDYPALTGHNAFMARLPPLADYERMLAQEQGAREMTTLMEARLQEWHDSAIAQGVQQGMRQGVHQGQADLLRRQAERRFGAETARRLSALLDGADAGRLIEVGDWIVECSSGDELLERVRQASGSA